MTEMINELQSENLPLFVKCSNAQSEVGENRDSIVPNSSLTSIERLEQFRFVGQLIGFAVITKLPIPLRFPPIVWKKIVRSFCLYFIFFIIFKMIKLLMKLIIRFSAKKK